MVGRRSAASGVLLALGLVALVPLLEATLRPTEADHPYGEYERALRDHPYNRPAPADYYEGPNPENPGARFEQEYLLTMNPETQLVPFGVLANTTDRVHARVRAARARGDRSALTAGWTERGPTDVGGRTRAMIFDPTDATRKRVYAGGVSGGLWYTNDITDSTEPWTNVDDFWPNIAIGALAYDPTNTNVWYAGTGEGYFNIDAMRGGGIFKSTNAGSTWTRLASTTGTDFRTVQQIVVTDEGTVLAATYGGGGVARSTNGGNSWTEVLSNSTSPAAVSSRIADLEVAANGDLYAATGIFQQGQVFKSSDDGLTWTHVFGDSTGTPSNSQVYPVYRIEIATAPSDSNRVYLVAQSRSTNGVQGVWRSTNGGASFQSVTLPVDCSGSIGSDISRGQGWYNLILAVNPTDADHVIVGGINLLKSTNGGNSWSNLTRSNYCAGLPYVHPDQHAVVYRPGSSQEVAIGNDGGVYYSPNVKASSPTWKNRNNGYNVTQFYSAAQNPTSGSNLLVGGTQDNGTPRLNGPGTTEELSDVTGGDGAYTHINQQTGASGFASNQYIRFFYTSNGGNSYSFVGAFSGGSFINPTDLHEGTDHLFFNYTADALGRLQSPPFSGSTAATAIGPSGGFGSKATAIKASEFGSPSVATVFVGTSAGRVYRGDSLHSGGSQQWQELAQLRSGSPGSVSSIQIGAGPDTLLVTISSYGKPSVYVTYDGGGSWTDLDKNSNLPDMPVWWSQFHPDNPKKVFIGTEAGLWYSEDITASPVSWVVDPEIPVTRVVTLRYRSSDRQLMAATHGRGIWTATVPTVTTTELQATVFLEGPYRMASDDMNAGLGGSLPTTQPFSGATFDGKPIEYDGIEGVSSMPTGAVDWLLVELRTGLEANTLVSGGRAPAILMEDGAVQGLEGGNLTFDSVTPGTYHVVVRHRNHIPIISSAAFDFTAGPVVADFTSSSTAAHAGSAPGLTELEPGVWGLAAADGDLDGEVDINDFALWLTAAKSASTGYLASDFDLDAASNITDFALFLRNSRVAFESQVPE